MSKIQSNISQTLLIVTPLLVAIVWILEIGGSMRLLRPNSAMPEQNKMNTHAKSDLASYLGLSTQASSVCDSSLKILKVWISPYRPFPEAGSPSLWMSRGLGDYEYLALLRGSSCRKLRINYGAFKHSPAHIIFDKARSQGIAAEMLTAWHYRFDSFVLDLNKVWLENAEFRLKCKFKTRCNITKDNFAVISLKNKEDVDDIAQILLDVHPKGQEQNSFQEYFLELTGIKPSEWGPVEKSRDGKSIWTWSKELGLKKSYVLGGTRLTAIPENLELILRPAPSIENLRVALKCMNGKKIRMLATSKPISISSELKDCQPESIEAISFSSINGGTSNALGSSIPPLGPNDNRRSLFALEASQ
jgi:hypothetical protein